jgi:hypothetical protein
VQVRGPDGTLLLSSTYSSATAPPVTVAPLTLTQTGTYHVVVGATSSSTGSYSFQILDADTQSQEVGDDFAGSFAAAREDDAFTFSGEAGQRITLEIDPWQTAALSTSACISSIPAGPRGYNAIDEAIDNLTFREGRAGTSFSSPTKTHNYNTSLNYGNIKTAIENLDITLHSSRDDDQYDVASSARWASSAKAAPIRPFSRME